MRQSAITRAQLPGTNVGRNKAKAKKMIKTLSMADYKPDPKRENEVLWGNEGGPDFTKKQKWNEQTKKFEVV